MKICVIAGDGIGVEVTGSCLDVLKTLHCDFDFVFADAGLGCYRKHGTYLPEDTVEKIKTCSATLFGAVTTDYSTDYKSPVLTMRKNLGLYANLRIIKSLHSRCMKNMDIVFVRENTEGIYVQRERGKNRVIAENVVSKKASERIIKFGFEYARINKRKKITCVHKANVLKKSDGMFRRIFYEIADGYNINADDCLVDACAMHLIKNPEKFDVIVTMNLYGDILSDEAAALVGGLGFVPGANIGEDYMIFEPAHGSAPDIAGKGIANPTAMIMSGGMMLEYLGMNKESNIIEKALRNVFKKGVFTPDVNGKHGTKRFTKEVIGEIKQLI